MGKLLMVPMIWPQFHLNVTNSQHCHIWGVKGKLFGIVLDPCFLWITALPTLFSGFLCIATQESFLFAFLCHMDQPKVGQLANDKLIGHWYGGGGFQIPSDICFVKIKPDMFPKATTYIHALSSGVVWLDMEGCSRWVTGRLVPNLRPARQRQTMASIVCVSHFVCNAFIIHTCFSVHCAKENVGMKCKL